MASDQCGKPVVFWIKTPDGHHKPVAEVPCQLPPGHDGVCAFTLYTSEVPDDGE
jgi:hypothetical protein